MESSELSYGTSTEERRKRSSSQPKTPISVTSEKPTYVRFLVSNSAAGSVIGKGGSTITDFQSQSGARIQLSRNHEFFPGTTDRIIMVSGAISDIMKALELILSKLLNELQNEEGDNFETKTKVRLIVPNSSCGGIIGKGGATVKAFMEESQAGIKISPQDNDFFSVNDRLVTLTGSLDEQLHAIDLIVSKLADDPHYLQSMSSPLSYPGVGFSGVHGITHTYVLPSVATSAYNAMTYSPNRTGGKFDDKGERSNSLTIGVADDHIGLIVGRGGRNIMDISQISGARIKISDRGDFMSGTNDRKVTLTGSLRAIRAAEAMILQKVAYASEKTID